MKKQIIFTLLSIISLASFSGVSFAKKCNLTLDTSNIAAVDPNLTYTVYFRNAEITPSCVNNSSNKSTCGSVLREEGDGHTVSEHESHIHVQYPVSPEDSPSAGNLGYAKAPTNGNYDLSEYLFVKVSSPNASSYAQFEVNLITHGNSQSDNHHCVVKWISDDSNSRSDINMETKHMGDKNKDSSVILSFNR